MAGRPPKPTALKILQGKPGHRPLPKGEPRPVEGEPACPPWLGLEERQLWNEWAPKYREMGCLTIPDVPAFAAFMVLLAQLRLCQRRKEPMAATALKLLQSYAVQFGGTPAGRARVSVAPKPETDPFEVFLGGKGVGK